MKNTFLFICFLMLLISCSEKKTVSDPRVLIDADIAFSDYSVKYGIQRAFIEFAADSVVLLKPNRMPILGKMNLIESYHGKSDKNLLLTWNPAKAVIAKSGELGFTYGFWTFISPKDTTRGTYLTIWKLSADGKWKYIADTGNEGLGK